MKKTAIFKKITAFAVAAATLFSVMISAGVHAEESKQMTTQLFNTKLASFISDVYADGSKYVNNSGLYRGIQCYGFANQLSKYMYGSFPVYNSSGQEPYADWTVSYGSEALLTLHIGDVVRYRSSASADHSIFITGMDDEKVYFSDANNDGKNTVRHNASMTWQKLIGKIDKALQSNSKVTGWVAHYIYWDDNPDHVGVGTALNFNVNGGQIPTEHVADRYIVLDALNMRSGPGLSYKRVTVMYDDTYFDIKCGAEFVESDGYVWAPVTQGSNSGWSVVSVDEWCKCVGSVYNGDYYVGDGDGIIYKTEDLKKYQITVRENTLLPDAEKLGLVREDCDFIGWSKTADGELTDINTLLGSVNESPLTLYAVWSQNSADTAEVNGAETGADTVAETNEDPAPETDEDPATETDEDTAPETGEDPAPETDEDPAPETDEDPAPETDEDTAPETNEDPAPETDEDTAPETDEDTQDIPEIICGDVNGDGELNNKDVIALFTVVSYEKECDINICDVNQDGEVNNKDIIYLFRMLSSFTGIPETDEETASPEPEDTVITDTEDIDTYTENPDPDDPEPADTVDAETTDTEKADFSCLPLC